MQYALLASLLSLGDSAHATCKVVPGSQQWPSNKEWASFNKSLGGVLLQPPPPGGVCHPGEPNYNEALCPTVATEWFTSWTFHEDNPISNAYNNWNNDSCIPDPSAPCSGSGYPIYVVNATTAKHVQKAVKFARKNNIRLNVKSSGHDFLGRSVAPNSLSIWLHYMQGIKLHDSFEPEGAKKDCNCMPEGINASAPAITFHAGDNHGAVYAVANTIGMAVPVAGAPTVCYGGYATGGGHSLTGARYGLAADQILEMTVVTPDGKVVVANSCQNSDLFWALRGGGGATFGVVISTTMTLNPDLPMVQVLWGGVVSGNTSDHFFDAAAYAFTQYPNLLDAGWAGYGGVTLGNSTFPTQGSYFGVVWFGFGLTLDSLIPLLGPIEAYVNQTWSGELTFVTTVKNWTSYYEYWVQNPDTTTPIGVDIVVGSRLIDKTALSNPNLSDHMRNISGPFVTLSQILLGGPGVHSRPLSLNSVSPAWRTAYSHTTIGAGWTPFDTAMQQEQLAALAIHLDALNDLAPNPAAYVNEADPFEENYHQVFWGDNYPRLLSIKRAIDPTDVFWCRACVGNEGWQEVNGQLCQV